MVFLRKFWTRYKSRLAGNDAPVFHRISRKVRSEKAAVFLEFAIALPLLLTISMFILELCFYWDTTVMANHAAFAISRMAKVNRYHAGDGLIDSKDNPYVMVDIGGRSIRADKAVTALLMMSSTFSWNGSPGTETNVDFVDFFTINKPLFTLTFPSDAPFFEKIVLNFMKSLVSKIDSILRNSFNNILKTELDKIMGGKFHREMNVRYAMALQRAESSDCVKTEIIPLEGSLKFPSDDYQTDAYLTPEVVKVSIDYPLSHTPWLYTFFSYWKTGSSGQKIIPVAKGRYAMLVEPAKNDLSDYYANPDGTSDIDPDKLKKEAEKRADKIVNNTSNVIDTWAEAVKKRYELQQHYGSFKKASKHKDFTDALQDERNDWEKVKKGIRKFRKIIEKKPKEGGLCGDKSDTAWGCGTTDFTKCARKEYSKLRYCTKIAGKIKKVADKYDLYTGKKPEVIHYVATYDAYPYHSHGICGRQYFCPPY